MTGTPRGSRGRRWRAAAAVPQWIRGQPPIRACLRGARRPRSRDHHGRGDSSTRRSWVTHLDDLTSAIAKRSPAPLAYFAFDLLYLDGHDLRGCALVDRKALLAEVIRSAGCPRLVYVDHVVGGGDRLFEAVRQVGAEGIVAKRADKPYRPGPGREWLKTKCREVGRVGGADAEIIGTEKLGEVRDAMRARGLDAVTPALLAAPLRGPRLVLIHCGSNGRMLSFLVGAAGSETYVNARDAIAPHNAAILDFAFLGVGR
jgi:hypothetical protein